MTRSDEAVLKELKQALQCLSILRVYAASLAAQMGNETGTVASSSEAVLLRDVARRADLAVNAAIGLLMQDYTRTEGRLQ